MAAYYSVNKCASFEKHPNCQALVVASLKIFLPENVTTHEKNKAPRSPVSVDILLLVSLL